MSNHLQLYNSFARAKNFAKVGGNLVALHNTKPTKATLYVCGPTLYDDCHVGHAINYIRLDLFRKFLYSYFGVNLITAMNVTDIDDKILNKVNQSDPLKLSNNPNVHPYRELTNTYREAFLTDLKLIKVTPPDILVKITDNIRPITSFIQQIESKNHAYVAANNDVYFDTSSLAGYKTVSDPRVHNLSDNFKKNYHDFVLWKAQKPGEPSWTYTSPTAKKDIQGRPGWHVQCSALATAIFGDRLDFHFGGKDLFFPHHYNEIACSNCFQSQESWDPSWSTHWLHSGHLVIKGSKMSKSLNNTVKIKDFVERSSVNALRLLCVNHHYRSDVDYSQSLIADLVSKDHKLNAFCDYLVEQIRMIENGSIGLQIDHTEFNSDLKNALETTRSQIDVGICDDFDLAVGLDALLSLSKFIYSTDLRRVKFEDLIDTWKLLSQWIRLVGLDYAQLETNETKELPVMNILTSFRDHVRQLALKELKVSNKSSEISHELLKECDKVRSTIDKDLGRVIRDTKSAFTK